MIASKSPMVPVVADDALYLTDNGRVVCGLHCGTSARYTGRDLSGQRIERVTEATARRWLAQVGEPIACEDCGKTIKPNGKILGKIGEPMSKTSKELDAAVAATLANPGASTAQIALNYDRAIGMDFDGQIHAGARAAQAHGIPVTDPSGWAAIFDALKPGQTIYISATSAMGHGRTEGNAYMPHKVGRRSKAKRPGWWSEAISLEPASGKKVPTFAKYKLWKSKDGRVSMSHGDMAIFLHGLAV